MFEFKFMNFIILWIALFIQGTVCAFPNVISELEYRVKAAFLLNFIRYTEWPVEKMSTTKNSLNICLLGKDPFEGNLQEAYRGKEVLGKNLEVLWPLKAPEDLGRCHVVFISKFAENQEKELLKLIQSAPILIVADSAGVESMISFVSFKETIQFEINLIKARKAGLKLSSRMIPLAKKVYE